jgi:tetratricopeptide (TPR) repeat protein
MKLTKKEKYLKDSGRSIDTINFCKECGVKSDHIAWFVDRIEKDSFDISKESSKEDIEKILKFFKKDRKAKNEYNKSIFDALSAANEVVETDLSIKSRILYNFDDGHYIINLSPKELLFEGFEMSNCVNDLRYMVENSRTAILALKDKGSKTICHLEINQYGSLGQHYQKANSTVTKKVWGYISEFFENNQDENFKQKMLENNLEILFSVTKDYETFFPIITSEIPTKYTVSVLDSENKSYSDFVKLKDYRIKEDSVFGMSKKVVMNFSEIKGYISQVKEKIEKSLDDFIKSIEMSKDNYLILNDETIKKIYGKKFHSNLDEKIKVTLHPESNVDDCFDLGDLQPNDPFQVYPNEADIRPVRAAVRAARDYQTNALNRVERLFSEEGECLEVEPLNEEGIPEEFLQILKKNIED